ncbi:MAG: hypothetical protein K0Q60_4249, partial [Microvirga sp.]|nr:hypothetical protein [Microvirga sp.]
MMHKITGVVEYLTASYLDGFDLGFKKCYIH